MEDKQAANGTRLGIGFLPQRVSCTYYQIDSLMSLRLDRCMKDNNNNNIKVLVTGSSRNGSLLNILMVSRRVYIAPFLTTINSFPSIHVILEVFSNLLASTIIY